MPGSGRRSDQGGDVTACREERNRDTHYGREGNGKGGRGGGEVRKEWAGARADVAIGPTAPGKQRFTRVPSATGASESGAWSLGASEPGAWRLGAWESQSLGASEPGRSGGLLPCMVGLFWLWVGGEARMRRQRGARARQRGREEPE